MKTETNSLFIEGITELKNNGFEFRAFVCDRRKGFLNTFEGILVQMCQFHQVAIKKVYL